MLHLLESIWCGVGAFFVLMLLSCIVMCDREYEYFRYIPITALSVLTGMTYYYS